jgi:hypothetical protein
MISAGAIYAKTAAGAEEVKSRKMKLAPKLRTMLILVDGTKPALILREEAGTLGAPADFLEQLESLGLVKAAASPGASAASPAASRGPGVAAPGAAPSDPVERFRAAQKFMNDTAVNALGIKAFFFTLKLEKCATVEELRGLVEAYRAAITKGSGADEAEVMARRVQEMLGG